MADTLECIRCGVCCICAPCSEDCGDPCQYLTIHNEGYTTCQLKAKNPQMFEGGCFLRINDLLYNLHREIAEEKVGIKLPGLAKEQNGEKAKVSQG